MVFNRINRALTPPPPSTHGIYASQTKFLGSLTSHPLTAGTTGCTDPGGRFLHRVAVVRVRDRQNIFRALLGAGRRPTRQPFRPPLGSRRDYGPLDSFWFLEDIRIRLSMPVRYISPPFQCGSYLSWSYLECARTQYQVPPYL